MYVSLGFILWQSMNAVINLVFPQSIKTSTEHPNVGISVLIPVRNEERNIGRLLESLRSMPNPNMEILVLDDRSTDDSVAIIERCVNLDTRIRLLKSDHLPTDWLGKNRACYLLAKQAKGDFYLFVDADVQLKGNIIADAVAYSQKHRLHLLSLFPIQQMYTLGEKISIPIMNYILMSLLPLIFVRISPFASHSAANGQFMLFEAMQYELLQPHRLFKHSAVEDIQISNYYKKAKLRVACVKADARVLCRMYTGYQEAKMGFAKNVLLFFGGSPFLAILFWTFTTLGFLPFLWVDGSGRLFGIYVALLLLHRVIISVASKQNGYANLLYMVPQQFFMLHAIFTALYVKWTKNYQWKGRNIYSS